MSKSSKLKIECVASVCSSQVWSVLAIRIVGGSDGTHCQQGVMGGQAKRPRTAVRFQANPNTKFERRLVVRGLVQARAQGQAGQDDEDEGCEQGEGEDRRAREEEGAEEEGEEGGRAKTRPAVVISSVVLKRLFFL